MERIRIIGLEKSFGVSEVFSNVSFEIKSGDRIALVGPNGAGKSTLLKCILGIEDIDGGQIVKDGPVTIGYLQQDVDLGDTSLEEEIQTAWKDVQSLELQLKNLTEQLEHTEATDEDLRRLAYLQERLEWLDGYDYEGQSKRIAFSLGFTEEDLGKRSSEFSGGQKTRINLAKALVRRPDFLFLDEPTNHLDMQMLEWLEQYLMAYKGGLFIISHDRYFLDRVANSVVELENHRAKHYKGNYSRYIEQRTQLRKSQQAAYDKQQEHIRKTEEYIDKYRAGIKSKMARGRQSQLNRLERLTEPMKTETLRFSFQPAQMSGDKVLFIKDLEIGYTHSIVDAPIQLDIRRGQRIGLIGPNGVGKSTFVKTVMGEIQALRGDVELGSRVQVGYFSQEHDELHPHWTILEEVLDGETFSEEKARSVLGAFLFKGDDVYKEVASLSGGEKSRLALLKLFLTGHNFLVLDEPTNHLDIPTREVVEEALQAFNGTCLIISHDRYFLDKVAEKILALEHTGMEEFLGNYSYYKEKLAEREALLALKEAEHSQEKVNPSKEKVSSDSTEAHPVDKEPTKKRNSYMRDKELQEVEQSIERWEATLKMYDVQLQMPEVQANLDELNRLVQAMEEGQEALAALYERWESLSE